jgi:hypothetical protein
VDGTHGEEALVKGLVMGVARGHFYAGFEGCSVERIEGEL